MRAIVFVTRPISRRLLWLVGLALGCATAATPGGSAGAPAVDTACWPIASLRVEALEHGREWEPVSNLNPDGTITNRRGTIGRIRADHVTIGSGDAVVLEGGCTGLEMEMTSPLSPRLKMQVRYPDRGEFVELNGHRTRIYVGDDGLVDATFGDGRRVFGPPQSGGGGVRVVGDVRRARRTAALLVFVSVASGAGRWSFSGLTKAQGKELAAIASGSVAPPSGQDSVQTVCGPVHGYNP